MFLAIGTSEEEEEEEEGLLSPIKNYNWGTSNKS